MATKKPRLEAARAQDEITQRATRSGRTSSRDAKAKEATTARQGEEPAGTGMGRIARGGYAEQQPCTPKAQKR